MRSSPYPPHAKPGSDLEDRAPCSLGAAWREKQAWDISPQVGRCVRMRVRVCVRAARVRTCMPAYQRASVCACLRVRVRARTRARVCVCPPACPPVHACARAASLWEKTSHFFTTMCYLIAEDKARVAQRKARQQRALAFAKEDLFTEAPMVVKRLPLSMILTPGSEGGDEGLGRPEGKVGAPYQVDVTKDGDIQVTLRKGAAPCRTIPADALEIHGQDVPPAPKTPVRFSSTPYTFEVQWEPADEK